jgi:predicted amidohydrolase
MGRTIKVAACQMVAELSQVSENLTRAERLIEEAFGKGARWVILPEFFTTGIAKSPSLVPTALPLDSPATRLLIDAARRHHGYVGASFISVQENGRFNTFVLAHPDGTTSLHNKDIPTMWENAYYMGGHDDGITQTEDGTVGLILCWEFMRWQTARRLLGKIDFVVGGAGWWNYPQLPVIKTVLAKQSDQATREQVESPQDMARILGVPVVAATLAGTFKGQFPLLWPLPFPSYYLGGTQIVDATGQILAHKEREEGAGVITAEIEPGAVPPQIPLGDGFWIRKLPWSLMLSWYVWNWDGRRFYKRMQAKGVYPP